jgi:Fic family protein
MRSQPVKYHTGGFPPKNLNWEELVPLVGSANAALARYDGLLAAVPNAYVLLSPLMSQEAVLSSRIEGTQATLNEVLEFEAGMEPASPDANKRNDIQEVINYREAIASALDMLKTIPLSQRVIKEAHRILLSGVRGQNRSPGEYKRIQNWIGPEGHPIETARYIPVSPADIAEGMGAWEKYIHAENIDRLVQLAILHAEFEALHPFLDGNGRIGRMLVPLFLSTKGLLSHPVFYISAYLEARREEYYDRLLRVSEDGDWTGWIGYFLRAIKEQAESNAQKTREIIDLRDKLLHRATDLTRSKSAIDAVDFLFQRPIFSGSDFDANPAISNRTALRIRKTLLENGILREIRQKSGQQPAILGFRELLNIVEGREVL